MEQISFFLTQYAGETAAAFGLLAVILLLVTLHRIRRIEKYMRKAVAGHEEKNRVQKGEAQGAVVEEMCSVVPAKPEALKAQPPEELIDAVLDEVFS